MRHWLLLLIAAVVVAGIAYTVVWIFTGGEEGLAPNEPDGRAVPLPGTRPLAEGDVNASRFDTALRGYRMAQVDAALRRIAYDTGYKQELIDVLEAEVEALRAGRRTDADRLRDARLSALAGTDTSGGGRHTAVEQDDEEPQFDTDQDADAALADYPTAEYEGVYSGIHVAPVAADADDADGHDVDSLEPADDATAVGAGQDPVDAATVLDGADREALVEDVAGIDGADVDRTRPETATPAGADLPASAPDDTDRDAARLDGAEPDVPASVGADSDGAEPGAVGLDGTAGTDDGDTPDGGAATGDKDATGSEDVTAATGATGSEDVTAGRDATGGGDAAAGKGVAGGKGAAAAGRTRPRRAPNGSTADKGAAPARADAGGAPADGASRGARGRRTAAKGSRTAPEPPAETPGGEDGSGDGNPAGANDESSVHKAASGR